MTSKSQMTDWLTADSLGTIGRGFLVEGEIQYAASLDECGFVSLAIC